MTKRLDGIHGELIQRSLASGSAEETIEIGRRLGSLVPPGTTLSLEGGLGVGKTVLAKGICLGLGVSEQVVSPSFVLAEEYRGDVPVFHFDLYRLDTVKELDDLGLYDAVDGRSVVIVEWGDRLPEGLLAIDVRVTMAIIDAERRRIRIDAPGELVDVLVKGESS